MNRFERHPVLTLVLVLAAMLVGFIAIAEWSLSPDDGRLSLQGGESSPYPERYLKLREWQPNMRFSFGPPETRVANAEAPLPETYILETDRFGFIEPSLVHEDAALEIVFVGGSTTQCLYVLPENRFPYVAGRLLEQRLGMKINGINAAKAGNNTLHSLLVTIGKLLPRRPAVVVLMQATNDIGVLKRHGSYWNEDSDFALVVRPERSIGGLFRGLRDAVVPHSYRRLRRALKSLAMSGPGIGQAVAATTLAPEVAARRTALGADFESALRSFTAVVRAWGSEPVLMTQAVLRPGRERETQEGAYLSRQALAAGDFTPDGFFDTHGYFNAIIRRVAYSEGVTLVDLAAAGGWSQAELYDGLHFTDRGSRRVADLVADAVAEKLEQEAAKP